MKTQRVVFPERDRCELEEAELDERLGPGEVLVRNTHSLISPGTELAMFTGSHRSIGDPTQPYFQYPFRPGYAALGEVVATNGSTYLKPEMRVLNSGWHTTFVKAKAEALFPVPAGMGSERAVFYRLVQIALTAQRLVPPRIGEQALVIGMGLVGNLCAQLLAQSGAGRIACADVSEARLERARSCGLIETYQTRERPLVECIKSFGERGAELVIEASGTAGGITDALKCAAPRGLVVLLGSPRAKMEFDPYADIHRKGVALIGAHESLVDGATRRKDAPMLLEWLRSGKLQVDALVTHRLPFTQAYDAYRGLRDQPDEFMGVVLNY